MPKRKREPDTLLPPLGQEENKRACVCWFDFLPVEVVCLVLAIVGPEWAHAASAVCSLWRGAMERIRKHRRVRAQSAMASSNMLDWALTMGLIPFIPHMNIGVANHLMVWAVKTGSTDAVAKMALAGKGVVDDYCCRICVREGRLDMLKMMLTMGIRPHAGDASLAAVRGHLDVLAWFKDSLGVSSFDIGVFMSASEMGRVEVLEWLRNQGQVDYRTTSRYARSTDVLEWLEGIGYQADKEAFIRAATMLRADLLRFLIDRLDKGRAWDSVCRTEWIPLKGCFRWLAENGFALDAAVWEAARSNKWHRFDDFRVAGVPVLEILKRGLKE